MGNSSSRHHLLPGARGLLCFPSSCLAGSKLRNAKFLCSVPCFLCVEQQLERCARSRAPPARGPPASPRTQQPRQVRPCLACDLRCTRSGSPASSIASSPTYSFDSVMDPAGSRRCAKSRFTIDRVLCFLFCGVEHQPASAHRATTPPHVDRAQPSRPSSPLPHRAKPMGEKPLQYPLLYSIGPARCGPCYFFPCAAILALSRSS